MTDDENSIEVLEVAGCIIKSNKDGSATIKCGEESIDIEISRDDIKILKGVSDIATDGEDGE